MHFPSFSGFQALREGSLSAFYFMNILITNDDGYFSPGIKLLKTCLVELGHSCVVVAPQTQKSGVSSALTLYEPIFCYPEPGSSEEYYISGTPVDCVKLALTHLLEKKPDLLLSGVNHGANIGINVLYSGTVAAALEGLLNGVPSVALSLDSNHSEDFQNLLPTLKKFLSDFLTIPLGTEAVWNVNFPVKAFEEIKGIHYTCLSRSYYKDVYEHRKDLRGRSYFWLGENAELVLNGGVPLSDSMALKKAYISVTPLTYEMTHFKQLEEVSPLIKWEEKRKKKR
jgi:5'-nucleotidase